VLDACGNPIGNPVSIAVDTAGLPASRRDGRVRAAMHAAGAQLLKGRYLFGLVFHDAS